MQHALERMAQWSGGRAGARAQQRHGEHMQAAAVLMEAGREALLVPNHDYSLLPHPLLLIHPLCFHFIVRLSSPFPSSIDLEQIMEKDMYDFVHIRLKKCIQTSKWHFDSKLDLI